MGNGRLSRTNYERHIIEEARRLFIKGYPPEKIARLPHMPDRANTIHSWKKREGWIEEKKEIHDRAREIRIERYAQEFADVDIKQLNLLSDLGDEIQANLAGRFYHTPQDLKYLAEALDKMIKNERLIHGEVTQRQEADVKFGWKEVLYATVDIEPETVEIAEFSVVDEED